MPQQTDVCIICALEEEADAVEQVIRERCNAPFVASVTHESHLSYRSTTISNNKGEPLTLALLCQTRPGPASAAFDLGTLLQVFQPCFVGMSGICAGDKQHVHLGDLVVAEYAYHFEEGKVTQDEIGRVVHLPGGIPHGPASGVLQCVRTFGGWETPVAELKKHLFGTDELPQRVITLMASGMAVRGDDPFEMLQRQHRETWALDMEAASLYFALHADPFVNGLVVKGVVDYADHAKDDTFHGFAARASAIYLLTFIQEYVTTNALLQKRNPPVFTVPYRRNHLFTGRESLLTQIHTRFQAGQATAISQPQAMTGLGGIGKTQLAVEYAYQHRQDYQTVLWTLADTRESLISGYVTIAKSLSLSEKDEQDQTQIVDAVIHWLSTHPSWLLVLDNVDDLMLVNEFLPTSFEGHLLLTTRAHAIGTLADRIEVDSMLPDVGALFLLRRAKFINRESSLTDADEGDVGVAREISEELGGLPLALDQAGAYIEETGCGLPGYRSLYRAQRAEMLKERGNFASDYPKSVAATWSLSFKRVEEQSPAAADLLRFSSFLAPDAIPEELLVQGGAFLGPVLGAVVTDPSLLNAVMRVLRGYSLIRREEKTETLSVHRLVQAVLRDGIGETTRKQWAERTVQAMNHVFPEEDFRAWPQCERYLPHALISVESVKQEQINSLEAAMLLHNVGCYLIERGRLFEAQPLLQQALALSEQHLGPEHTDTAGTLDRLAHCFELQGKYGEAEPLYRRALSINERQLGIEHPSTARSLDHLALLLKAQGKYDEAEPLYRRALSISEKELGIEHPDVARDLHNLASLYRIQGKYDEAEPLYRRALSINEKQLGTEHPHTAFCLNNLAGLYYAQERDEEAEPLFQRALTIREHVLGETHPDTATSLNDLANLYRAQGKYSLAEPLYRRVLEVYEQKLGVDHPWTAAVLTNLAILYWHMGKYELVEPLYQRALAIDEQKRGAEHPSTAYPVHGLAELYQQQGKYAQAEASYKRALAIRKHQLGPTHPETQRTRKAYVAFLRLLGRDGEADAMEATGNGAEKQD